MEQYIPKSALVAEIERLVNNQDSALDYEAALEDVRNFINTIEVKEVQEEPVSEELEEVSKEYADKNYAEWLDFISGDERDDYYTISEAFKAGAQWQKNKMMEDAVDGVVAASAGGDGWVNIATGFVKSEDVNVNFGDKIKIIVVKED